MTYLEISDEKAFKVLESLLTKELIRVDKEQRDYDNLGNTLESDYGFDLEKYQEKLVAIELNLRKKYNIK